MTLAANTLLVSMFVNS